MRICFLCSEIFEWGKYGGFGRATRMLGRELARRGYPVSAVVPLRGDQKPVEQLDGITVLGFPASRFWQAGELCREADADIYHSQQPSLGTYVALRAMPDRKHIVTSRDPRDNHDWWLEIRSPSRSRLRTLIAYAYEGSPPARRAVKSCDGLFHTAHCVRDKMRRVYRSDQDQGFLPTPVEVPASAPVKSETPTVCFVGRWDRRKRPELFFELAKTHPHVQFIALGKSQDEARDRELHERYADVSNLEMMGFINQFTSNRLSEVLGRSWILINTSTRESLPTSFLEALAHRCALLSQFDPEQTSSRFGYHAEGSSLAAGLASLLEGDAWREKGEAGFRYVSEHYELQGAIDRHVEVYEQALVRSS